MKLCAVVVLLGAALTLTDGSCYPKTLEYIEGHKPTQCQDDVDGTWHDFGSHWKNSRCMSCSCTGCCFLSEPGIFPEDCVSVLDTKACEYKVHKKDDPSVLCPVFAMIGK